MTAKVLESSDEHAIEAEAVAQIFVMAFRALPKPTQQAVFTRLQNITGENDLSPQPASSLRDFVGLVSWGGDARLDSERYYDDL